MPVGANSAVIFQYSDGTNASISRSRSTTRRRATDCTRPALERRATFLLEQIAERIADDAVENAPRFLSVDAVHVDLARMGDGVLHRRAVISLKVMRKTRGSSSRPKASSMCQAMASPSRSGSVAR